MRTEQYEDAIGKYTRAIELDSSIHVFYCNRAAARSKMNNHYAAVRDCQRAIDLDPKYGKAYGRIELAYSSIEKHKEEVNCFNKAIAIEPGNESYQSNMNLAEEKLAAAGNPGASNAASGGIAQGEVDAVEVMVCFLRVGQRLAAQIQCLSLYTEIVE